MNLPLPVEWVRKHEGAEALKYLRRFVWYLASRLLLICVVLGLMIVTFYYAMNMANIQVVLKDGMAYRAQVVMMDADPSELTKYFMPSFLEQDQVLLAVGGYRPCGYYRAHPPH